MNEIIKLMRNNAAIDAVIRTKDECFGGITSRFNLGLEDIAVIGDEVIDLPMLSIDALGLIGAPANAQGAVKKYVSKNGGFVSEMPVYRGFQDFYGTCSERGIKLIVSDKDGVLKKGSDLSGGVDFSNLAMQMGQEGNPYVVVLTGSSLKQNEEFRTIYGLDSRLNVNPFVVENPYLLLVESGAIHVNVLTGETENYVHEIAEDLLGTLKGEFETSVRDRLRGEAQERFGFGLNEDYNDQKGNIYYLVSNNRDIF